jgi:hypothetical protein
VSERVSSLLKGAARTSTTQAKGHDEYLGSERHHSDDGTEEYDHHEGSQINDHYDGTEEYDHHDGSQDLRSRTSMPLTPSSRSDDVLRSVL